MSCAASARPGLRPLAIILAVVAAAGTARGQTVASEQWPEPAAVEITMVGPEAALASIRAVTSELLAREGVAVVWHEVANLRVDDVLEAPIAGRGAAVLVWVDASSPREARIYFRAAAGRRYVIRRVSLPGGMGPLAVEEIAQIVQSVLRALASDTAWALSLSEARVALSVPEPRSAPAPVPPHARAVVVEVGSAVLGQLYAPGLPFVGDVELSFAALSRPAADSSSALPGSLGGRVALAYGFPAHFSAGPVGADLQATTLRLELIWEPWRAGRAAVRLGLGGGADRVAYTPAAEQPGATAAAGGTFVAALGCFDAALRLEVVPRLTLALGLLAEISLARVHYDAYDASGSLYEALVPHRVRPGATIGVEVRL